MLKDYRILPKVNPSAVAVARSAEQSRPIKRAIIFLHGLGDRGDGGLLEIGEIWMRALPDCAFLCPDAPFAFDMAPPEFGNERGVAGTAERADIGRQWFSLQTFSRDEMLAGAQMAAPYLNDYLDYVLKEFNITPDQLIIAGFSQGTMMALYTALRRAQPVAGIIGYSGMLLGAETLATEKKCAPPVLLVHGTQDAVVPFRAMAEAEAGLKAAGIPVTVHRTNTEHTIDNVGVAEGLAFIKSLWPD